MKLEVFIEVDEDSFYGEVAELQVCLRKLYDELDYPGFWMKSSSKFPVESKVLDTNGNTVGNWSVTIGEDYDNE